MDSMVILWSSEYPTASDANDANDAKQLSVAPLALLRPAEPISLVVRAEGICYLAGLRFGLCKFHSNSRPPIHGPNLKPCPKIVPLNKPLEGNDNLGKSLLNASLHFVRIPRRILVKLKHMQPKLNSIYKYLHT